MTRVTRVSYDNANIAAEHQEPAEVLSQLGNTSNPPVYRKYKCCWRGGLWCPCGGLWCRMWQFSIFIGNCCKQKSTDIWRCRRKSSVSLIKQVALAGQQHEAFGLQGRIVDVAHVGQAHPCYKSRTTEYPHWGVSGVPSSGVCRQSLHLALCAGERLPPGRQIFFVSYCTCQCYPVYLWEPRKSIDSSNYPGKLESYDGKITQYLTIQYYIMGLILRSHPANERRRYKVCII